MIVHYLEKHPKSSGTYSHDVIVYNVHQLVKVPSGSFANKSRVVFSLLALCLVVYVALIRRPTCESLLVTDIFSCF